MSWKRQLSKLRKAARALAGRDSLASRNGGAGEPGIRHAARRSSLCRVAPVRECDLGAREEPGNVGMEFRRDALAGPSLRPAHAGEESRLHGSCGIDASVGHRCEHRDLQRGECELTPTPAFHVTPIASCGFEEKSRLRCAGKFPRLEAAESRLLGSLRLF